MPRANRRIVPIEDPAVEPGPPPRPPAGDEPPECPAGANIAVPIDAAVAARALCDDADATTAVDDRHRA